MKKIITSLLVVVGVTVLAVGVTMAYFTDTATSTTSTLASGTLELVVNNNNSAPTFTWALGNISGMAPGDVTDEVTITIRNGGTIPFAWFGYFNIVDDTGSLADVIYIDYAKMEFLKPSYIGGVWEDTDVFIVDGRGAGLYSGYYNTLADKSSYEVITLTEWNKDSAMGAGGGVQMGALKTDYSYRFTFKLGFAPGAGNDFQGKSMDLSYTVDATQINAGALDELFTNTLRLGGVGSNHLPWLNLQIDKQ
jgi:predicted ribosomally synthesized peptide with SipW-like signal peptide